MNVYICLVCLFLFIEWFGIDAVELTNTPTTTNKNKRPLNYCDETLFLQSVDTYRRTNRDQYHVLL